MKKLTPRGEEGDMGLVCPRCTHQKQTNPKENQEANLCFFFLLPPNTVRMIKRGFGANGYVMNPTPKSVWFITEILVLPFACRALSAVIILSIDVCFFAFDVDVLFLVFRYTSED